MQSTGTRMAAVMEIEAHEETGLPGSDRHHPAGNDRKHRGAAQRCAGEVRDSLSRHQQGQRGNHPGATGSRRGGPEPGQQLHLSVRQRTPEFPLQDRRGAAGGIPPTPHVA